MTLFLRVKTTQQPTSLLDRFQFARTDVKTVKRSYFSTNNWYGKLQLSFLEHVLITSSFRNSCLWIPRRCSTLDNTKETPSHSPTSYTAFVSLRQRIVTGDERSGFNIVACSEFQHCPFVLSIRPRVCGPRSSCHSTCRYRADGHARRDHELARRSRRWAAWETGANRCRCCWRCCLKPHHNAPKRCRLILVPIDARLENIEARQRNSVARAMLFVPPQQQDNFLVFLHHLAH